MGQCVASKGDTTMSQLEFQVTACCTAENDTVVAPVEVLAEQLDQPSDSDWDQELSRAAPSRPPRPPCVPPLPIYSMEEGGARASRQGGGAGAKAPAAAAAAQKKQAPMLPGVAKPKAGQREASSTEALSREEEGTSTLLPAKGGAGASAGMGKASPAVPHPEVSKIDLEPMPPEKEKG
eukprot:TRINITY_DN73061_c0_g1_i1.p1 TRINITY_DN73061_c0_g1~~TRINITY_DN73061_c0_g1_i1.p1  ORF type:complete len:179 (-),score=54.56 TRINITY_DN73061_c0_g1_i1:88-624(-)